MLKYRALTISLAFAAVGHFSPAAAQPAPAQNEVEDGFAFVTFVQSISAQKAALTCERGEYPGTVNNLTVFSRAGLRSTVIVSPGAKRSIAKYLPTPDLILIGHGWNESRTPSQKLNDSRGTENR
jgi:hypothetical protein